MSIWSIEIKQIENLYESLKGQLPDLIKELGQLIKSEDANVILLYSRRCLEVIITDLCECELKRPRKTEPLKGIIDKLHKEEKVPAHIISSMQGLNELSTYGAHPKDYDPDQVKPVLVNLGIIVKWYLKYKDFNIDGNPKSVGEKSEFNTPRHEKSIIVLPFENISSDPEQEYFSDGLTEEIITDLSYIKDLLVISRSSAMTFKGSNKKIKDIANEVNVQYVLEGSVRKAGNNLRITAQLIDALTDTHLWAEKYNGTLDDVFDIQEKVSRSIADSLPITLSTTERKITKSYLKFDSLAYDCLLKARYDIWLGAESSIKRAIGYLNEAKERIGETIEILSAEAEAYYLLPHITGEGFENSVKTIEKNVEAIFKIDHASAYGYLYQGLASTKKDWGFQKASNSLKQAYDLNPRDTSILIFRALVLSEAGYPDKALFYSNRLFELDPITPVNKAQRSFILLLSGQFESSKKLIGEVMSIDPKNSYYGGFAAVFFANMGEKEELLRITEELQSLPIDNWVRMGLMYGYALQDKIKDMNKILTPQFKHTAKWDETFSWTLAQCFACVNNFDESLYWLENAVKRGFTNYPYFNDHDPFLGKMRSEERFKKLMERVKYEWENFEV